MRHHKLATPLTGIYYKTNGNTPTTSSTLYAASFAITAGQTVTIKVIAPSDGTPYISIQSGGGVTTVMAFQ